MIRLSALFTLHCSDRMISQVFWSLGRRWQGPELYARMVVPSCEVSCRSPNLIEAIPRLLRPIYYRFNEIPRQVAEQYFLKDLKNFDAAYLWPGTSLKTYRKVKTSNKPIFVERINCYNGKSKHILDDAYIRLGLKPQHTITSEKIHHEDIELSLADFIFCPSPAVKDSFQEAGVPEEKLITTSEGWCSQRLSTSVNNKEASNELTFLFAGSVCVRKGVHLLLNAWDKAQIKGRLILLGNMEPAIAQVCADLLSRSDVTHIGFRKDYEQFYRKADIFIMPSLEEGSPLVTYEAMAHDLPILASPMGAGGIVRDGIDGLVIPPYDEDAWIEALRKLAASPERRRELGNSSRQRATEFTWDKVAAKRAQLMLEKLNGQ